MHSYNPGVDATSKKFKDLAVQVLTENHLTQESLADSLACTQGTVSRWLAYTQDLHMPAFALAVKDLPDVVAIPLLSWIARQRGWVLSRAIPVVGDVNGSLNEEAADTVRHLGDLLDDWRNGRASKMHLQKHITDLKEVLARAEAEVEARS